MKQQTDIDVSVVIVNYNTFDLTSAAIRSLRKFVQGINYEIILVDNASTETSADRFQETDPSITLIKSEKNLGFAGGNNLGIQQASGKAILLMNSDAELLNDAVSICYKNLFSKPSIGITTGKLEYADGSVQHQCGKFPSVKQPLMELFRIQKFMSSKRRVEVMLGGYFNHESTCYPDWVWGTFFMFRTEILNKLPGKKLPEDFFMYAEDLQWCYEITKLGYRVHYDPAAKVLHHFSGSVKKTGKVDPHGLTIKNEDLFLSRYYGKLHSKLIYFARFLNLSVLSIKDKRYVPLRNTYSSLLLNRKKD